MTTEPEPRRALDSYGPEEMAIPEWKIIQAMGGEFAKSQGGKLGQFYNTITNDIVDELSIVVVDVLTGRSRWGEEITDSGPICASLGGEKSIYNDDCTACPHRVDTPWAVNAAERRTKCCLNYTILGIDLGHDYLPVLIRAHGISALPARELITQLKMNRALRGEYHRAIVKITSLEKTTKYGMAYALHTQITELITDKTKAEELKGESVRLLGTPLALPVGRPEDEPEPLGYTSSGVPFFSEEEKQRLLAAESAPAVEEAPATPEPAPAPEPAPTPEPEPVTVAEKKPVPATPAGPGPAEKPASKQPPAAESKKQKPATKKPAEAPQGVTKEPLDLDF